MDTDQILDLFSVSTTDEHRQKQKEKDEASSNKKASAKAVLENLENLWDERQYEEEYNLDTFIESLK
jgi:TATA-binding protein-associated factor